MLLGVQCAPNAAGQPRGPKRGHLKAMQCRIAALERAVKDCLASPMLGLSTDLSNDLQYSNDSPMEVPIVEPPGFCSLISSPSEVEVTTTNAMADDIQTRACLARSPIDRNANFDEACVLESPQILDCPTSSHVHLRAEASYHPQPMASEACSAIPQTSVTSRKNSVITPETATPSPEKVNEIVNDGSLTAYAFNNAPHLSHETQLELYGWTPAFDGLTCLKYAMWTLAAFASKDAACLQNQLYTYTRALLSTCEIAILVKEDMVIEHAQAWILVSLYELNCISFERGSLSVGRSCRIVHLMGLNRIDHDISTASPSRVDSATSNLETEVRRRTFWSAYLLERFVSFATPSLGIATTDHVVRKNTSSWAFANCYRMTDQSGQVLTRLPMAEASFQEGQTYTERFLYEALAAHSEETSSSFAKLIVLSTMIEHSLLLQRQASPGCLRHGFIHQDVWEVVRQSIQSLLYQQVSKLLSAINLDSEVEEPIFLFEDITALVVTLRLCVRPMDARPRAVAISRYERKALSSLAKAMLQLEKQPPQIKQYPLMPVPLFLFLMLSVTRRNMDPMYEILGARAKALLQSLADTSLIASRLLSQSELWEGDEICW
ncbi:hypothetical protein AC579_5257 [Pseudocercospora musae]|uniref:Xylanolytic transcriptional activator regulatory domain-containing protein n=1 Tax=Pseudocercospora musae TaxID=113226 RepID=A0A139IQ57_9PEZI|nr:hypothetical protein AC579_5257 [Pseudocercospora musae]